MDLILTLLLSLVAGIMAALGWILACFFVTGVVFHLGAPGIGLTEIGAIPAGIALAVISFRKVWS